MLFRSTKLFRDQKGGCIAWQRIWNEYKQLGGMGEKEWEVKIKRRTGKRQRKWERDVVTKAKLPLSKLLNSTDWGEVGQSSDRSDDQF